MTDRPPKTINQLVERFTTHRHDYRSPHYNETQVRREFIDPMFKALGWDIDNEKNYAEPWKEVVHEDAIKVGGATKAPDYSFRLGGKIIFFLEAKRPSVNLKNDVSPAFQLRRYAWTAKLPLSILTDFEEFIVYDTRVPPAATDKAAKARILYIDYTEYLERWADIANVFSPEAIRMGAFDKYAASTASRRGTAEVDDAFLAEIEHWREQLARNIALRNPNLTQRELNYAVQLTIDRIIFLRICEDRGVEPYGRLQSLLNGAGVYDRLRQLFSRADERYNSGLFYFQQERGRAGPCDELTPRLQIDDRVLKSIFKRLYYPDCPYEFSVLPADILGHVYERFLGSVIQLSTSGRAKVKQKPEVRKAGGVYYTPTYVVDYIVRETLGKLLEGKSPQQIAGVTERWRTSKRRTPLAVLDPACGSGSFLLGAYQTLLDWYLEQYIKEPMKWSCGRSPRIYEHHRGGWRLTTAERKRILLVNIYGVDIDPQATEVTKLSLLLKVLEGEDGESLQRQLALFHERALPDLGNNIKCGNSLIGVDFYEQHQISLLDEEEAVSVNAFDWNQEFPSVMQSGGFDVVIGNPPYLYSAGQEYPEYFAENYRLAQYQTDFYVYFIERALELTKRGGLHSFIVTDSWLNSESFSNVRRHLLSRNRIDRLALFDFCVFRGAIIENSIYICVRAGKPAPFEVDLFSTPTSSHMMNTVAPEVALERGLIDPYWSRESERVVKKVERDGVPLETMARVNRGLHAYRTDGYGLSKYCRGPQTQRDKDEQSYHAQNPIDKTYLPEVKGRNVYRYYWESSGRYISYGEWLAEPRTPEFFFGPKIALRKVLGPSLHGTYIPEPAGLDQALYIVIPRESDSPDTILYCLGILVSPIGAFYLRTKHSIHDRLYPWYTKKQLANFPIPPPDSPERKEARDRIVKLVNHILHLHGRLSQARTRHDRTLIQRQISATDNRINRVLYCIYGLSEDEVLAVESGAKTK